MIPLACLETYPTGVFYSRSRSPEDGNYGSFDWHVPICRLRSYGISRKEEKKGVWEFYRAWGPVLKLFGGMFSAVQQWIMELFLNWSIRRVKENVITRLLVDRSPTLYFLSMHVEY